MIHYLKSICFLIACVLGIQLLFAQELKQDSLAIDIDTAKINDEKADPILKEPIPWSIFVEISGEYAPQPDDYGIHQQLGMGASFRLLHAGWFINLQKSQITRTLVFPNEFDLIYLHGGGYVGLTLINSQQADLVLRYNYSQGGMVWENSETKADLVRDNYSMSKPELVLQYRLMNFLSFFVSGGYKIGHGIQVPGVARNDFNGFTVNFGGRLGFFHLSP